MSFTFQSIGNRKKSSTVPFRLTMQLPGMAMDQKVLVSHLLPDFGNSLESARLLTHCLLSEYWKLSLKGKLPIRDSGIFGLRFQKVEKSFRNLIARYAQDLMVMSTAWASFEIGRFYMSLLPADFRSENGIYYTPPPLVSLLLDLVQQSGTCWKSAQVLDPACGGGAFVAPVVAKKIEASGRMPAVETIRQIGWGVKGLEIDPFAAWLSQVFADLAAAPLIAESGKSLPLLVEVTDALQPRIAEEGGFDLVVGNPPYSRITASLELRQRYSRSLYGHANLYGMFTDQALRLTRSGGIVAFVTPTSFLGGQYFQKLRSMLRSEAFPVSLDFVSDRSGVFDDVQQETMLAIYRKATPGGTVAVGTIDTGRETAVTSSLGRFSLPASTSGPWLLPRTSKQKSIILATRHLTKTLTSFGYSVNTGPLVWNRFKNQMASTYDKNCYPIVWAESVSPDCHFVYRSEKRNHTPFFRWDGPKNNWLLVDTPCILMQRTTAKEQARRLISAVMPTSFIRKHTAVVVENHLNMIRPCVSNPSISLAALAAVLRSATADALFRCINGSVAVSAYELESLPLPGLKDFKLIENAIEEKYPEVDLQKLIDQLYIRIP